MVRTVDELQQIQQALASLQEQVRELTVREPATGARAVDSTTGADEPPPVPPAPAGESSVETDPGEAIAIVPVEAATGTLVQAKPEASAPSGQVDEVDLLALLRAGMAELATINEIKDVPRFFGRLASRVGLRFLLLKKWKTGLQVLTAVGIKMPVEACQKRRDGRAPIPLVEDGFFTPVAEECCIYAGPVPIKHFPLDLTLLLGRGSKERQIVVLPLPVRDHWNTFIYLDADLGTEKALAAVEILAHHALARMCLLLKGLTPGGRRVAALLKEELARRQESQARRLRKTTWSAQGAPAVEKSGASPGADSSPGGASPPLTAGYAAVDLSALARAEIQQASSVSSGGNGSGDETLDLTPDHILRHSGELPALPRAACHILAVIEDPKTTATSLEKAIATDQALTAKVLRIANSPFYGAVRDIKTVSEAIVRLGFVTIRNWTLVAATKSVFLTPGSGLLFQKIWRQSVLSAMASQLVAQAVRHREPEAVFIGGLMQNIGQLVLARAEPELFHQIMETSAASGRPYHEVERELLGFDHGELGAQLIREWNLSQQLEEAVRAHHQLAADVPERLLAAMIGLGEEIAACTTGAESGEESSFEGSSAAKILDISAEQFHQLQERAHDLSIDPQFFA